MLCLLTVERHYSTVLNTLTVRSRYSSSRQEDWRLVRCRLCTRPHPQTSKSFRCLGYRKRRQTTCSDHQDLRLLEAKRQIPRQSPPRASSASPVLQST